MFAALALAAGCVFGYRSEAEIEATWPLTDVQAVRIALPRTPLSVVGDPMAVGLELRGEWRAAGGSQKVAKANARTPRLVFDVTGGFGRLGAVVPLAVDDQVDLEVEEIRLPPDLDLELQTALGDVDVIDVVGNIGVDVDVGDVDIEGGDGGVAVRTGDGRVRVESAGNMDLRTSHGTVEVWQAKAGGNDVVVRAEGDVRVWLISDADLDLDLKGREIRVQTGTVSTITSGSFRRAVGGGHVKIWIDAGQGQVEVRLGEPQTP
ncbi:hypothetical protein [Nannocystis sp. SCPEA4]|uniref:hypothetical protein n=1 Tax=Nannocystis sp. SCPEA4 TaxID=2996787 RepID=UPI002270F65D|nr:hypothetical protein [Nannocystis sp. SCPEA4]MCY1062085.1 hypothetical protein [Nannocystis sp. SCPEA4]